MFIAVEIRELKTKGLQTENEIGVQKRAEMRDGEMTRGYLSPYFYLFLKNVRISMYGFH